MKIVTFLALLCLSLGYVNSRDLVTGDLTGIAYTEVTRAFGIPLLKRAQIVEVVPTNVKLTECH